MGRSCPLGISRFVPAKAEFFGVIFWPYNKSFIDQACSVKMAGYWPSPFFAFFMDRDEVDPDSDVPPKHTIKYCFSPCLNTKWHRSGVSSDN